jgi:Na+/proline symporter
MQVFIKTLKYYMKYIYYLKANNLASAGDYAGARRMSNNAKKLIITSVVIGIIGLAVYVALQVVVINESYRSSNSY